MQSVNVNEGIQIVGINLSLDQILIDLSAYIGEGDVDKMGIASSDTG
jgi:hypothetical protein